MIEPEPPPVGVCLLRAERQGDRLLITVTTSLDVARGTDEVRTTVRPEVALSLAREFIERFAMTLP